MSGEYNDNLFQPSSYLIVDSYNIYFTVSCVINLYFTLAGRGYIGYKNINLPFLYEISS